MDVLESALKADHFLDELEPVVQGGAVVVVFTEVSKGSLEGAHPERLPVALEDVLLKVLAMPLG